MATPRGETICGFCVVVYFVFGRVEVIEKIVTGFLENLEKESSFEAGGPKEAPTSKLWTYYYLAQHHDHRYSP